LGCGRRFTTKEDVEELSLWVMKKDGRREAFDVGKLRKGIEVACEKRPISGEEVDKMLGQIEKHLVRKGREVRAEEIGKLVCKVLKRVDDVAYVRFASVYQEFADLKDFKKLMKEVAK
jgi:transcriptional repressor NrdR